MSSQLFLPKALQHRILFSPLYLLTAYLPQFCGQVPCTVPCSNRSACLTPIPTYTQNKTSPAKKLPPNCVSLCTVRRATQKYQTGGWTMTMHQLFQDQYSSICPSLFLLFEEILAYFESVNGLLGIIRSPDFHSRLFSIQVTKLKRCQDICDSIVEK